METIEADFGRIEAFKEEMLSLARDLKTLALSETGKRVDMLGRCWKETSSGELLGKMNSVIEKTGWEAGRIEDIVDDLEVSSKILFGTEMYNKGVGVIRRYL